MAIAPSCLVSLFGSLLSCRVLQLLREGGVEPLIVCMRGARVFPKTAREALRAMGAAAQHKAFGMVLLKTQGAVRLPDNDFLYSALYNSIQ